MLMIRQFNTEREGIEELVAMYAFGMTVKEQFEALDVEEPEWLTPKLKAIKRQIAAMVADKTSQKLDNARARLEGLKSPQEKKADTLKEIDRLKKQLAEIG